jgi:hypothetical protein
MDLTTTDRVARGLSSRATPLPSPPPQLPGDRLLDAAQHLTDWAGTRSWLLPAVVLTVLALLSGSSLLRAGVIGWQQRRFTENAQQVLITPPAEVDPAGAGAWWANLAGLLRPTPLRRLVFGAPHLGLEYRWAGRQVQIIAWVPATVAAGPVAAAVRAAWPGAATRIVGATAPLPAAGLNGADLTHEDGAALVALMPAWYPLAIPTTRTSDPLRALLAAGSDLGPADAACVQVLARVAGARRTARARAGAAALKTGRPPGGGLTPENLLTGALHAASDLAGPSGSRARSGTTASRSGTDPMRERDARPGLEKLTGPQWEVAIRIGVTHTEHAARVASAPSRHGRLRSAHTGSREAGSRETVARQLRTHMHALASAMAVHDARNRLRRVHLAHPSAVLAARTLRGGFLLSTPELVALAGLPLDVAVAGLDRARAKAVAAPITVPPGGRSTKVLGRAQVGGHSVALPVADARQHLHVLGSTGAGKSTFLTHLILDDIAARRAVVLIDPKGDLARDVLDRLPLSVMDRLVLIDPDQPHGSATFNPLQLRHGADADLIADNIVSIFAAIFQRAWGPRIDDVIRVSCLTLMRHPHPTLANIAPLLNDKQFRAPFTVGFDDPAGLKGFWEWYESTPPALRAQVIGPVLARMRSFLLRDFVRTTIGPVRSSFDMHRVLNHAGILIARLPKGQLGEDTSRLLGSLIFASVWQTATARAALGEHQRKDASIVIDEAHNVLNLSGTVSDMLAEARGYHLSMVLAHQHLAQLPRETQLALSANARNKIFFSCSPEDAVQLARHTRPELDEHDLSHLDAYIAATRLIISNRETAAFTLATTPPRPATGTLGALREQIARTAPPRITPTPAPAAPSQDASPPAGASSPAAPPAPTPQPSTPQASTTEASTVQASTAQDATASPATPADRAPRPASSRPAPTARAHRRRSPARPGPVRPPTEPPQPSGPTATTPTSPTPQAGDPS